MTLIIGIDLQIDKDKYLYLAGDRCGSNGFIKDNYVKPKIFKRDDYAFGYTTSFRMGQLLEHSKISKDLPSWKEEENVYTSFIDWAKMSMKDGGYLQEKNGEISGGNFIFFNGRSLYEIQNDFSVLIPNDGLLAVGQGEYHAKGIMRAYMSLVKEKKIKFNVNELIDLVYKTVSSLTTGVSCEYDVLKLESK